MRRSLHGALRSGAAATRANSEDQLVIITFTDTGVGIPKEIHDQIFVPNFSTKSSGTGLGLAITKKIIQEHGGEISFTSEAGKGTSFYIELPAFVQEDN